MSKSSRRLAAIMFTDIIGYTALMGQNEERAFELLKKNRTVLKPLVEKFNGRWLKEIGDGVLASFDTVSDAVYCAGAIQKACEDHPDLNLRIGIHQGEVVFQGDDVFGDGVNIASRLEPLAPAGGILVSQSVHNNISNKSGVVSEFAGEVELKNVSHPVRTYLLSMSEAVIEAATDEVYQKKKKPSSTANKKFLRLGAAGILLILVAYFVYDSGFGRKANLESSPPAEEQPISIAVLPFKNNSGDAEMEPFCDGMTDEVISRLAKIHTIDRIIPRTSIMRYKNTEKSIPELGRELGVTHILEGSFQKFGEEVKINLQLIDAPTEDHYWSDDYQGQWGDIFAIQAEVAENVAKNLNAQITETEIRSLQEMPTKNIEAYNSFLQAEFQRNRGTKEGYTNAIPLYEKAIEFDPNFVRAYTGLAEVWILGGLVWAVYEPQEAWKNAQVLLEEAQKIDPDEKSALAALYQGKFYYEWDFEAVEAYYQTAEHELNSAFDIAVFVDYTLKTGRYNEALNRINYFILEDPAYGVNYGFKAEVLMLQGRKQEALDLLATYDPLYEDDWWYLRESVKLHNVLKNYKTSAKLLEKLMDNFPDRPPLVLWLNAVHYQRNGNKEETANYLAQLNERYKAGTTGSPAWFIALYHVTLNNYEEAFAWLQISYERHEVEMLWLKEEPILIPLREDPRYIDLYHKIGYPDL